MTTAPALPADETPRLPARAGPAGHRAAAQRHQLRHPLRTRSTARTSPSTMTASPVVGGSPPSGAVIVFRDTSERKAFEEQLARHAFQDALTGLANRRLLLDHLDHALLAGGPDRQPGGGALLRHRPLQGGQRQPGPPGGRRAAAGHRRAPAPGGAARRHAVALRRRRVRRPARGRHLARRRRRGGRRRPRGAARPDHAQRRARGGGHHEHRRRPERVRQVARRPAARRRRGHVPGQGAWPRRPVRPLRRRPHGRPFGRPARPRHGAAPRGRARRGRGPLPAAGLPGRPAHRRGRGAGALEPSRPRHPAAGAVHQAGRGQRHHPPHRRAGARAGLPAGPDVAAGVRRHARRSG